jgi:hypothetical protein
MKTLLRHTRTGLYFQGPEKWTSCADIAYDFHFIDRARQFVEMWEMEDVEVAFAFEDSQAVSMRSLEKMAVGDVA